jgi:hypothetical protein
VSHLIAPWVAAPRPRPQAHEALRHTHCALRSSFD